MAGYIKDHRKELESNIWIMPPLYHRVWQYLKYKVNHEGAILQLKDGSFLTIQSGEHLTSIRSLAKGVGWMERGKFYEPNKKSISTILGWLKEQKMIDFRPVTGNGGKAVTGNGFESNESNGSKNDESNALGTLITIVNWALYQLSEDKSNGLADEESNGSKTVTGNGSEPLPGDRTRIINNNTTVTAREDESIKTEKQESESPNPLKQLEDEYCQLHAVASWHITPKDTACMLSMIAGGMPVPFIVENMRKIYAERLKMGRKINSFSYYEQPLGQAWEKERSITTPVPSGTVAIGRSQPRYYELDETDPITQLMLKVSGVQHAEH